jgi:hypothetical protein
MTVVISYNDLWHSLVLAVQNFTVTERTCNVRTFPRVGEPETREREREREREPSVMRSANRVIP